MVPVITGPGKVPSAREALVIGAKVRVLFRPHQLHVAYERRNPSGDISRFTIGRSAVGPITAETVPERAVRITARE